jgi:serine/threonine-protein kinase
MPKVLDFGLAKAWSGSDDPFAGSAPAPSQSPTLARTGTAAGLILGTAAYMAPEQARGKPVDKRSDIWSFGVVLFEMLTGRKLFDGETVTDVLAAVVRQEIDWSALPGDTPPVLRRLLRRCLERDPKKRLRDVGEARLAIDESSRGETPDATGTGSTLAASAAGPWVALRRAAPFVALAAAAAAGAGYWAGRSARPAPSMAVTHLEMGLAPAEKLGPAGRMERPYRHAVALTPDGRRLVFAGVRGETTQLYVRSLEAREAVALPGTEGADTPFLSPDGRWVAFLADGRIRKTPVDGGPVETVAELAAGARSVSPLVAPKNDLFGASWGEGDVIVFGRYNDGLWKVRAGGGTPAPLTTLGKGDLAHRLPRVLPGGKAVLFQIRGEHDSLAVVPVEGGSPRTILESAGDARPSGASAATRPRSRSGSARSFTPRRARPPPTARSSPSSATGRAPGRTSGSCPCEGTASRGPGCKPRPTRRGPSSLPTAVGWRTARTSRAGTRSTCVPSPVPERRTRSRWRGATRPSGPAAAASCSS